MTLVLAPRAARDIRRIAAYLREHDANSALETLSLIVTSIQNLERFPHLGRNMSDLPHRRLPIPRTHYVAFYRIAGGDVLVLHVRDGRRGPPKP